MLSPTVVSQTRQRRSGRIAALLLLMVTAVVSLLVVPGSVAFAADGDLSTETFQGDYVADGRWQAFGDACLTGAVAGQALPAGAADIGACAKTVDSPPLGDTPGFLQLTDNSPGSTSNVLFDRAFPSTVGLEIKFTQYQYAVSDPGLGPADGIGFFLTDGRYTLDSPGPTGTLAGGALGYGTIDGQDGVQQGYLGLGLDVFGNYSSQPFVGESCTTTSSGSPGAVALRGPGNGSDGYCLLSTTPYANLQGNDYTDAGRVVEITVTPVTAAEPFPTITVTIDGVLISSVQMTVAAPPTFKMGFSASTGQGHEVHLINLFSVSTLETPSVLSLVKSVDHTDVTGTPQTIFTAGETVPFSFVVTNTGATEPVGDIVVTDPKIADISCPETKLEPQDSFLCTGTYGPLSAAEAAAGEFENTGQVNGVTTVSNTPVSDVSTAVIPTYPTGVVSLTKAVTGTGSSSVPENTAFTVDYSYPSAAYVPASVDAAGNPNIYPAGTGTIEVRNDGVAVASDAIPVGAVVSLTERTPAAIDNVTWGSGSFSSSPVTIDEDPTPVTLTNPAALDAGLGVFTVVKNVTGTGAGTVPEDTSFQVDYEWVDGPVGSESGSGTLVVQNDGVAVSSPALPEGAVVSLSEQTPAAIDDVTWAQPTFSSSSLTIGADAVEVQLTNPAELVTVPVVTPPDPADPTDPANPDTGSNADALGATGGTANPFLIGFGVVALLLGALLIFLKRKKRNSLK